MFTTTSKFFFSSDEEEVETKNNTTTIRGKFSGNGEGGNTASNVGGPKRSRTKSTEDLTGRRENNKKK